jgi:hypothetical protein
VQHDVIEGVIEPVIGVQTIVAQLEVHPKGVLSQSL